MLKRWLGAALVVGLILQGATAFAQCNCGTAVTTYAPAVTGYVTSSSYVPAVTSYVTSYAPAVTYYTPQTYAAYSPTVTSYTSYYAPAAEPYVAYSVPATPYMSYYAPTAGAYVAYSAPTTVYAPTVTPYVAGYAAPGTTIYGTEKVYVRGEPIRNFFRAITP